MPTQTVPINRRQVSRRTRRQPRRRLGGAQRRADGPGLRLRGADADRCRPERHQPARGSASALGATGARRRQVDRDRPRSARPIVDGAWSPPALGAARAVRPARSRPRRCRRAAGGRGTRRPRASRLDRRARAAGGDDADAGTIAPAASPRARCSAATVRRVQVDGRLAKPRRSAPCSCTCRTRAHRRRPRRCGRAARSWPRRSRCTRDWVNTAPERPAARPRFADAGGRRRRRPPGSTSRCSTRRRWARRLRRHHRRRPGLRPAAAAGPVSTTGPRRATQARVALVGKGITFDSRRLSIKPAPGMGR